MDNRELARDVVNTIVPDDDVLEKSRKGTLPPDDDDDYEDDGFFFAAWQAAVNAAETMNLKDTDMITVSRGENDELVVTITPGK